MLYRTLLALVQKGMTDGLAEKIDIFFAAGKITEEQYTALVALLPQTTTEE